MQDAKQALAAARRAIAIADSKDFGDDIVNRVMQNADEELKDAGLRRDDDTGVISEAA